MKLSNCIFAFITLCALTLSCGKKLEVPGWEVNLDAAVITSDMGIEDIIPDSLLQVNPDNSVNLVYSNNFFNYGIDSLLTVPDSTIKDSFIAIISTVVPPNSTIFTNTDNNDYVLNDVELIRLILKQGFIDYTVKSTVTDTMVLIYSITTGTISGTPITITVTIPPGNTTTPAVVNGTFDMANADMDLTGALHNTVNAYQTKLTVKTGPGTVSTSLTALSSKVSFYAKFRDMIPKYVKGYFGNFIENTGLQISNFDFIKNIDGATLDLAQVNTNLYITNGLGADARIIIDTFMAVNSKLGTEIQLTHSDVGRYININRATDMIWYAQPWNYSSAINSSNSNIESMIELIPDQIKYKIGVELNPNGNISANSDFLYENSRVSAGLDINIPLQLMASGLNIADTVKFDLNSYDQNGKIIQGKVKFNVINGIPLNAVLSAIMLDENNMVIGTLIGPVTINGNTTSSPTTPGTQNSQVIIADLTADNIETAYRAKKLIIKSSFATSPTGSFVNLYTTQRFKTQISIQVDYLTKQ